MKIADGSKKYLDSMKFSEVSMKLPEVLLNFQIVLWKFQKAYEVYVSPFALIKQRDRRTHRITGKNQA